MNTKHLPTLITLICLTIAHIPAHSQTGPAIQWQNTIGGFNDDFLNEISQTSDGGYIITGHSFSNIAPDKSENCIGLEDYWIIKTDSTGNIQWENTIGGVDVDRGFSVHETIDGGYIVGGSSLSGISGDKTENSMGGMDNWIIKLDMSGTIQWQNTIGGNKGDGAYYIQQTNDGGYIFGGTSDSDSSGDKTEGCIGSYDYWIVKTDSVGNIQWQNTIGGYSWDVFYSLQQTADGGYIIGGHSGSMISGDKNENLIGVVDFWIVKIDSVGNIQWQNTIGGNSFDYFQCIRQTNDGGYIAGGGSMSDSSADKSENCFGLLDYWIVKLDTAGNIIWENTIGGSDYDFLKSVEQTSDGGYLIGGSSMSNISGDKTENCKGNYDYWIVKTDSSGNIVWQNTIGGGNDDYLNSIGQTPDGGYILGGNSKSNISPDKTEFCIGLNDYWIIKLAPDTITSITTPHTSTQTLALSPNPAKDNIILQLPTHLNFLNYPNPQITQSTNYPITISILSTIGQSIYTSTVNNEARQVIIPVSHYPAGMYIAKVTSGDKVYTSKFVVQ